MEDILASIKKVIAEEKELRATTPTGTITTPAVVQPAIVEDAGGEDVLELHEPVVESLALPKVDLGPPLVSDDAAEASRARLTALQEIAAAAPPMSSSVNPLEQVVRDMLKPILKDWLDHHLPAIVDEHVRREIMRITGTPL